MNILDIEYKVFKLLCNHLNKGYSTIILCKNDGSRKYMKFNRHTFNSCINKMTEEDIIQLMVWRPVDNGDFSIVKFIKEIIYDGNSTIEYKLMITGRDIYSISYDIKRFRNIMNRSKMARKLSVQYEDILYIPSDLISLILEYTI